MRCPLFAIAFEKIRTLVIHGLVLPLTIELAIQVSKECRFWSVRLLFLSENSHDAKTDATEAML